MTSYVTPGTVSIKAENEAVMKTFCQNVYVPLVSAEEYMALNTVNIVQIIIYSSIDSEVQFGRKLIFESQTIKR